MRAKRECRLNKLKRDAKGKYKRERGYYISSKGYPRYSSGQYRHKYVHRVIMDLHLLKTRGKGLAKDEDVHHKNGNKLDFRLSNLQVLGHREHGCVSSKQRWYLNEFDKKLYKEFAEHALQESAV